MVDKDFCISSFLVYRYIIDDQKEFCSNLKHQVYKHIDKSNRVLVSNAKDVDDYLTYSFKSLKEQQIGILLSGGMDSACLASYMRGCNAYTFRFCDGEYQKDELKRAESFAKTYELKLHYVDISWNKITECLDELMINKGAPVHSIEPQIYVAAKQAEKDGVKSIVIGDAADYVFGGMDKLHEKDWEFDEFVKRYTFLDPFEVLINPVDVYYAFEEFRQGNKIDFIKFMHKYADTESFASYENAFLSAKVNYVDPYEPLKMKEPLDLNRIRSGESKYIIRELFKMKYPQFDIPEKNPMPRPVDLYFENWDGPKRKEFVKNLDLNRFTGNQKWQLFCLEYFLNLCDKLINK